MSFSTTAFWVLVAIIIGFLMGWRFAHITIADECEKLNKFYIGKTVYNCNKEEKK